MSDQQVSSSNRNGGTDRRAGSGSLSQGSTLRMRQYIKNSCLASHRLFHLRPVSGSAPKREVFEVGEHCELSIVLGDTLIAGFSPDEIETVLAHELGHHVNRDIPLGIAFQSVVTLAGLYLAQLGLQWGVQAFGFSGAADIAAFPIFAAVMGAFGVVTLPLGNAFSRWRERLADRYALDSTHKPEAFMNAMTRLANQNLSEVDPEPWVEFLLYSHPAIGKRIAMAKSKSRS